MCMVDTVHQWRTVIIIFREQMFVYKIHFWKEGMFIEDSKSLRLYHGLRQDERSDTDDERGKE
nr:MAG TPA: hypothetical protein [Caudoviricetes sp.]